VKRRHLAAFGALLVLSGCGTYSLVEAGRVRTSGGRYTIETPIAWSALDTEGVVFWTVDGLRLQMIVYFNGVEDGDPLFDLAPFADSEVKEKAHRFGSEMDAFELRELFVATWSVRKNWEHVEATGLRPVKLGSWPGFRFEFTCMNDEGLEYRGLVTGAVVESRLYMILYQAPRQYYYERYAEQVEAMLRSIRPL
jgi:hypothetical protein